MAGSYGHLTEDDDRTLRIRDDGTLDVSLLENMGDMTEAVEELVGMIWYLSRGDREWINQARRQYREGLGLAGVKPL